jgi:ABC-type amino acid transport substrate-binding protein
LELTLAILSFINSPMMRSFTFSLTAAFLFFWVAACTQTEQGTLQKIRKQGEIKFAVSTGYIPFSYYSSNREIIGFDIDMAKEIAGRLGVKAVFVDIPWGQIIDNLRSGTCDVIISSMAVTEERSVLVDFSDPYYYSRSHLFVRKDSSVRKFSEIKGKVIGCTEATTYEKEARLLQAGKVVLYGNDEEALQQLVDKRIDAVITDEVLGMYAIRHRLLPIEPVGNFLRSEKIAIAVRKGDVSLLKEINAIIKTMRDKGIVRELIEKTGDGKYR